MIEYALILLSQVNLFCFLLLSKYSMYFRHYSLFQSSIYLLPHSDWPKRTLDATMFLYILKLVCSTTHKLKISASLQHKEMGVMEGHLMKTLYIRCGGLRKT